MTLLLVENAEVLVTMDRERGEISGLDLPALIKQHNQQAQRLLHKAAASR